MAIIVIIAVIAVTIIVERFSVYRTEREVEYEDMLVGWSARQAVQQGQKA